MESLTYLGNMCFDASLITRFITEKDQPISPIAWRYFSSEADGYPDYSLSQRICKAIFGIVGTLIRTISDLFIRIICLFNYTSTLSTAERCRQLFFCLGRDLGVLGSCIALLFTNKALHWIEHNRFQRKLLLLGTKNEVLKYTLFEIAINFKHETMKNLAKSCEKQGKLDELALSLIDTGASHRLKDISFLTEKFDVEYWMQESRFIYFVQLLRDVKPTLETIKRLITDLEKAGKYGAVLYLLLKIKEIDDRELPKISSYLSELRERKNKEKDEKDKLTDAQFVDLITETLFETVKIEAKQLFLFAICSTLIEQKQFLPQERGFIWHLLSQISLEQERSVLTKPHSIDFLETQISGELIEDKTKLAMSNISTYVRKDVQKQVTASLFIGYCESEKMDQASKLLTILPVEFDRKEILQMALASLDLKPITENRQNLIFNMLKRLQEDSDKNSILNVLFSTLEEDELIGCLKNYLGLLLPLLEFLKKDTETNKNSELSMLLLSCLKKIKEINQNLFDQQVNKIIPGIVEALLLREAYLDRNNRWIDGRQVALAVVNLLDDNDDNKAGLLRKCKITI